MYAERRGEVKDPDKGLRRTLYRCTKTERYYITRKGRTVKKKKKKRPSQKKMYDEDKEILHGHKRRGRGEQTEDGC